MTKVNCKRCVHFRKAPYAANITGCWHPDSMTVTQSDPVLDQQQIPGDHRRINLRHDCALFEALPKKPSLLARLFKSA